MDIQTPITWIYYRCLFVHTRPVQEAPLRKTTVEIDDDLIARVRVLLGTSTIKETIDTALREVERQEARLKEIKALIGMDGLDLADERVMSVTWRY